MPKAHDLETLMHMAARAAVKSTEARAHGAKETLRLSKALDALKSSVSKAELTYLQASARAFLATLPWTIGDIVGISTASPTECFKVKSMGYADGAPSVTLRSIGPMGTPRLTRTVTWDRIHPLGMLDTWSIDWM